MQNIPKEPTMPALTCSHVTGMLCELALLQTADDTAVSQHIVLHWIRALWFGLAPILSW